MRRLINEIGCGDEKTPIILYGDNLSSQALAKNPVHHSEQNISIYAIIL